MFLATAHIVALETTLFCLAGPVCSKFYAKPAPLYKLVVRLANINKYATLFFLLSDYCSVLGTLSSHSLAHLAGTIHSPILCGCDRSPVTHFVRMMARPMN